MLGQPADVVHELGEVLAPLGLLDRVVQRLARDLEDVDRRRHRAPHVVDAAVVGDAVEPGAQVHAGARRRAGRRRRARTRPGARPRRPGAGRRTASGARRRTAAGGSGRGSTLNASSLPARKRASSCSSERRRSSGVPSGSRARLTGACSAEASTDRSDRRLPSSATLTTRAAKSCCESSTVPDSLHIRPGVDLPLSEIELRTSRSSGPGGQHANVTASRVEAVFDVQASETLTDAQKARVAARLGPRVTAAAQDTRSQLRNRELALERLAAAARPRPRGAPPAHRHAADQGVQAAARGRQEAPRRDQARAAPSGGRRLGCG